MFTDILLAVATLAGLGLVFGILIGIVAKVFHVEEDPRFTTLLTLLPGYNCGACGHPGCAGLAGAIVEGRGKPNQCKPMKKEDLPKIAEYIASWPKE